MIDPTEELAFSQIDRIDSICDAFEHAWKSDPKLTIETQLELVGPPLRRNLLKALLSVELELQRRAGFVPQKEAYLQRFPQDTDVVSEVFCQLRGTDAAHTVLGNYVLHEKIGQGGMGAVYRATNRNLGKTVAVKLLPHPFLTNAHAVARFRREMQAVGKLEHPNIVRAMDAGEVDGTHYLVMEFVPGTDLSKLVKTNGPLSCEYAVHLLIQAAKGLEYAHRRGIVHRDIKPSNLLACCSANDDQTLIAMNSLDAHYENVKVLDLGLARLGDDEAESTRLTASDSLLGTVDYMSPEQAEDVHSADARSDIYSLGCTLFFLLTGQPPYQSTTQVRRLLAHREQPIPSLSDAISHGSGEGHALPSANSNSAPCKFDTSKVGSKELRALPLRLVALDTVFRKMVAKNPADRFATMADVISALKALHSGDVVDAEFESKGATPSVAQKPAPPRQSNRIEPVVAIAIGLLLTAGMAAFFQNINTPFDDRPMVPSGESNGPGSSAAIATQSDLSDASLQDSSQPPSLEKWLKDREVLTVAQDGSAMFRSIQAALESMQAGQVVEVLDEGPYDENLNLIATPMDTGLISRVNTRLQAPRKRSDGSLKAHLFRELQNFRLSGFTFMDSPDTDETEGGMISGDVIGDLIIEKCVVITESANQNAVQQHWLLLKSLGVPASVTIRDNWITGRTHFFGEGKFVLTCNYFAHYPAHMVVVTDLSPSSEIDIHHNVFHADPVFYWDGNSADINRLSICNNTFLGDWATLSIAQSIPSTKFQFERNLTRGRIELWNPGEQTRTPQNWQLSNNINIAHGEFGERYLPPTSRDTTISADQLSIPMSIESPNYARVMGSPGSVKELLATVGALPPGPPPIEGDWFTRVRERFLLALKTPQKSSTAWPVITEPQSLDNWWLNRTVLRVAQDGRQPFRTMPIRKSSQFVDFAAKRR